MAMKACRECKREISSDVTACPNCGKKNPHNKTTAAAWLGLLVVGFVVYAMVKGVGASDNSSPTHAAASVEANTPAISVSNTTLWNAYQANEVAADNVYKGKPLIVDGKVGSITKGIFDEIVVHLASPNEFMNTGAHMDKSQSGAAAGLRKGKQIRVRCMGGGMVVGSPVLEDCTIQ